MAQRILEIVNPNKELTDAQVEQIKAMHYAEAVTQHLRPIDFPLAKDGGLVSAAFESAMRYPKEDFLWVPNGLSVGAAVVLAIIRGRNGSFPRIAIFGKPQEFPFIGPESLDVVRHAVRQERYTDQPAVDVAGDIVVLNFSHPIDEAQQIEIAKLLGTSIEKIEFREKVPGEKRLLSRQYVYETVDDLTTAVREQITDAKISPSQWQGKKIVVNLPAHSAGAMIALAAMHGRMGYFPFVLRIEKGEKGFHFTQAIDLEVVRERAMQQQLQNMIAKTATETESGLKTDLLAMVSRLNSAVVEEHPILFEITPEGDLVVKILDTQVTQTVLSSYVVKITGIQKQ